jgi:phosphoadenosine phosphosulfate reductase
MTAVLPAAKLERTRHCIRRGLQHCPRGLIAWSGGKDSMVLLHLLRSEGAQLPLVFFREPWQPAKYAFHERILRQWNLLAYSWHPTESAFQQRNEEFELQNTYRLNGTTLTCPSGITPPAADLPWVCGLDMLQRPKQSELVATPFDALWIGHKRCDSDPILGGDVGTRIEARPLPHGVTMLFPLRDWSHEEIWAYIETHDVPYDAERYEKVDGTWRERPERRRNADYVHACTRCLDRRPDAPRRVYCPKLEMEIENMADQVPWIDAQPLSYMRD